VGFGSRIYTSVRGVHKELSLNYFIPKVGLCLRPQLLTVYEVQANNKGFAFSYRSRDM